MNSGDIMVRSQFKNQNSPKFKGSVKSFIQNYMLRDQAVEPLVINADQQKDYINRLQKLNAPYDQDATGFLNHKLHYSGIGFDKDKLALNRTEQTDLANQCQNAYDRGGTVKQMVISFRTSFLKENGVLDDEVKEPVRRGDLHLHVDQRKLRQAVQDGFQSMFDQTSMHNPQYIAAVQTDTQALHIHVSVWDNDPSVKNDRGMVNNIQKKAFMDGCANSLKQQPNYVVDTGNLQMLGQQTQQHAQFKRKLLENELYQSALRLDKNSLDNYVNNLAMFDQRTLSIRQRENVEKKIKRDWVASGKNNVSTHTLSVGERRSRRQLHAMKRSYQLRNGMRGYLQAYGRNKTAKSSQVVFNSLSFEYKHQMQIVEKYRGYQRPRMQMIYDIKRPELEKRRLDLLKQRESLLPKLNAKPLSINYIGRLLKNTKLMQGVASTKPKIPLTQNKVYKDLAHSLNHPEAPLEEKTIHTVVKHSDNADKKNVETNLRKNQSFNQNGLSNAQRFLLARYEQQLLEYEMDAVSWGGLSTKELHKWNLDKNHLDIPPKTKSIYQRPLARNDSDILASDVHHILDRGNLKPQIELSMRKLVSRRYKQLKQASHYFNATDQLKPQWLRDSQKDLNRQFKMLEQSSLNNSNNIPTVLNSNRKTQYQGYLLNNNQTEHLVKKHVKEIHELDR